MIRRHKGVGQLVDGAHRGVSKFEPAVHLGRVRLYCDRCQHDRAFEFYCDGPAGTPMTERDPRAYCIMDSEHMKNSDNLMVLANAVRLATQYAR